MMKKLWISILFILCSQVAQAATYNIGPGQTYETFTALVASETLAGDDIVDGGDNTFREQWTVPQSGTSGHVITLQNAVIKALDVITDEWTASGTNGEYYVPATTQTDLIFKDGVFLDRVSTHGIGTLAAEEAIWDSGDGGRIYYKPTSGAPSGTFEKGLRNFCIDINNQDYITLSGITVVGENGAYGGITDVDERAAIRVKDAANISMSNVTGSYCRYSAITLVDSATITMDGLDLFGCSTHALDIYGSTSAVTITNSAFHDNSWTKITTADKEGMAIRMRSTDSAPSNISISLSDFYNNGLGSSEQGKGSGLATNADGTYQIDGLSVFRCRFYDNDGSGISLKECINTAIYSNLFWSNGAGTATGTTNRCAGLVALNGNGVIYGNVFYNNNSNSSYAWRQGQVDVECGSGKTTTWVFKNNILSRSATSADLVVMDVGGGSTFTFTTDYNIYHETEGNIVYHYTGGSGTSYTFEQLANWQSAISGDANAIVGDPKFYNPALNDFRVHSDGAGVEKGTDLGATYQRDYYGHWQGDNGAAWDIGTIWFDHKPTIQ